MNGLLLDTHVWIWHVDGSPRLPGSLRRLIDGSSETCWLSPISVWEFGRLAVRGRLTARHPIRKWFELAHDALPLREAALTSDVALRSNEIHLEDADPMDHLIAASALVHDLMLATVDEALIGIDWLPTVPL